MKSNEITATLQMVINTMNDICVQGKYAEQYARCINTISLLKTALDKSEIIRKEDVNEKSGKET